ncbi:restriction endonuclease subunit S [Vibrio alginolyticus]|uniref:restriction endonuclease subunit S n=1 Tax=Vibrio alginolyticus TaxID=663 RepID=UPI003754EB44
MTSSVKFSEIAELVMGQSPKGADCNETGDGFPLLNGPTEFTERSPLPVQFTTAGKKFSKTGDILFCVRGSTTGRMNYADQAYAIGRGIGAIRGINGYPTAYIRAVLEHNLDRLLVAATGSTFPNVGKDLLNNFEVNVCSPEQAQQANKLLVGIEDKRYLNSQTNQTLEEMAQAIFKSWFVDFDPVKAKINGDKPEGMDEATASLFPEKLVESELGLIPEGWSASSMGEHFNIIMGQSPKGETYNEEGEGIAFFQGRRDFGFRYPDVRVYTTDPKRFAKAGDTLISVRAPVGDKNMAAIDCCIGRGVAAIKHKSDSRSFTYAFMSHIEKKLGDSGSSGTVFSSINQKELKKVSFVAPPQELIEAFHKIVDPIDQKVEVLSKEIESLSSLRDTLLPKLLSGEIELVEQS